MISSTLNNIVCSSSKYCKKQVIAKNRRGGARAHATLAFTFHPALYRVANILGKTHCHIEKLPLLI